MAKSIFKTLSDEQKSEIVEYYLFPHSASDTLNHFHIENRRDLDRILAERGVAKHSWETLARIRLTNTCVCDMCGKSMCVSNLPQHLLAHQNNTVILTKDRQSVSHDGLNCIYCGKECKNKNSLAQHECRCSNNPNRKCVDNLKVSWENPWNSGLTKDDERIKHHSESMRVYYSTHGGTFTGRHHSEETRAHMSEIAKNDDRYLNFHGSRKSFEYNGVRFMSSYEVEVAKDLDENNVKWEQPNKLRYLDQDGNTHNYIADFYLPEYDVYLDPKNDYLINNPNPVLGYSDIDKIKWVEEQNKVRILILNKTELSWEAIKLKLNCVGML